VGSEGPRAILMVVGREGALRADLSSCPAVQAVEVGEDPKQDGIPVNTNELIRLRRAACVMRQSWPFRVHRRTRLPSLNYQAISVVSYLVKQGTRTTRPCTGRA
jgi:hypothetical protein